MDELGLAIENVKQRFMEMQKAVILYDQVKQETRARLRASITSEEWPVVKSKMKVWLDITQNLIDRDILCQGFDNDCVFCIRFKRKKPPRLRVVGSDYPPKLEKLLTEWEELTQYLLSKGYLDKIPDVPGFELRNYVVGIQEIVKIIEQD